MDPALKQAVHDHCRQAVAVRIASLEGTLRDLAESVANETKSTAGDKYETARAMLHIEQDGIRRQLADARGHGAVLDAIDPGARKASIGLGSLVRIDATLYYLSVGLGRMQVDGQSVVALSLQAPLGARLQGLAAGDELVLNGKTLRIDAVL